MITFCIHYFTPYNLGSVEGLKLFFKMVDDFMTQQ